MSGVTNKTAKVFKLSAINNGKFVKLRLHPGFNSVDDQVWKIFVKSEYVEMLKEKELIRFGKKDDDKELDASPQEESITISKPAPKKKKKKKNDD